MDLLHCYHRRGEIKKFSECASFQFVGFFGGEVFREDNFLGVEVFFLEEKFTGGVNYLGLTEEVFVSAVSMCW